MTWKWADAQGNQGTKSTCQGFCVNDWENDNGIPGLEDTTRN